MAIALLHKRLVLCLLFIQTFHPKYILDSVFNPFHTAQCPQCLKHFIRRQKNQNKTKSMGYNTRY